MEFVKRTLFGSPEPLVRKSSGTVDDPESPRSLSLSRSSSRSTSICRSSHPTRRRTHVIPWDDFFESEVNRFASMTNSSRRQAILQSLDLYVRADFFTCPSMLTERSSKRALITLWQSLLRIIETKKELDIKDASLMFDYILMLMNRYEFDLIHHIRESAMLSPDVEAKVDLNAMSDADRDIALQYRSTLMHTISYAIEILNSSPIPHNLHGSSEKHRPALIFAIRVLSVAFFRTPVLSNSIMDCCQGSSKVNLKHCVWKEQLRDNLHALISKQKERLKAAVSTSTWFVEHNPSLFQWAAFNNKADAELLHKFEKAKHAQRNIRSAYFFSHFFHALLSHVIDTAHGEVSWSLVPGYWAFVDVLLCYVLETSAPHPAQLLASVELSLYNKDLVCIFAEALLRVTSVHDKAAINQTLDCLDSWFCMLVPKTSTGAVMPESFCWKVWFAAFDLLMNSEQFQVLLKALWFLYTHADRHPPEHREHLLSLLLGTEGQADDLSADESEMVEFTLGKSPPSHYVSNPIPSRNVDVIYYETQRRSFRRRKDGYSYASRSPELVIGSPSSPRNKPRSFSSHSRQPSMRRTTTNERFVRSGFFYKLFLHWCPEVRRLFHYTIIYKIHRNPRRAQQALKQMKRFLSNEVDLMDTSVFSSPQQSSLRYHTSLPQKKFEPNQSGLSQSLFQPFSSAISLLSAATKSVKKLGGLVAGDNGLSDGSQSPQRSPVESPPWVVEESPVRASPSPNVQTCSEIFVPLEDGDETIDRELWQQLTRNIMALVKQSNSSEDLVCPNESMPYVQASLSEFSACIDAYFHLQHFVKSDGIITPDLYFEIVGDNLGMVPDLGSSEQEESAGNFRGRYSHAAALSNAYLELDDFQLDEYCDEKDVT